MASYIDGICATTSKNLDFGRFDETNVLTVLKEFVKTLEYTKLFGPERISDNYKSKVYSVNANIETLLQFWQFNNARKRLPVESKVDIKLWENELSLRYMFEEYIEYMEMTTKSQVKVMNLFCKICKMSFPESADYLHDHLKGVGHLICYDKMRKDEEAMCDALWDDHFQKCKYSKFLEYNGPNNSLYCKVCCVGFPKHGVNLKEHMEGRNHVKKYEEMVKFLFGDDENKLNDHKMMKDKVGSFMKTEKLKTATETKDMFSVDSNLNNLSSGNINNRPNVDRLNNMESVFVGQPVNKKRDFEQIKEFLSQALVNMTMELLQEDGIVYKNVCLCCLCQYVTSNLNGWNAHCDSPKHSAQAAANKDYRLLTCTCSLTIICDEQTYNWHLSSPDHQRMKDLMQCLKERAVRCNVGVAEEKRSSTGAVRKASNVSNPASGYNDDDDGSSVDSSEDDNGDIESDSSFDNLTPGGSIRAMQSNIPGLLPDTSEATSEAKRIRRRTRGKKKNKNEKKEKNENSVSIVGLKDLAIGTEKEDIIKALQHLGQIINVHMLNANSANITIIIKDEFRDIVDLQLSITIKGANILISKPIRIAAEEIPMPESVRVQFSSAERILNMMDKLMRTADNCDLLEIFNRTESKCSVVEKDVKNISSEIERVVTIGSRGLGLAQNDAKIDLFVEMGDNYFGNKSQDLLRLSARTALIDSALINNELRFANVQIVGDEEQVVQFDHRLTGLKCRIFCHNGLAVEKSNLIKTYLNYDERVRKVILIIREWAQQTGLTNVISQYAVTWLVLFSLMQGSAPLLLPVIVLRNKNEEGRKFIAGWDCRFCQNTEQLPKTRCGKTVLNLVMDFFNFYGTLMFIKHVFVPLTGECLQKKAFMALNLPPPFNRYVHKQKTSPTGKDRFEVTNGLCLEDPLELNDNLTEALVGPPLQKFIALCKAMSSLIKIY